MKATQGVILTMIAALVLWLVWSNRSPFGGAPPFTTVPDPPGGWKTSDGKPIDRNGNVVTPTPNPNTTPTVQR